MITFSEGNHFLADIGKKNITFTQQVSVSCRKERAPWRASVFTT